MCGSLSPKALRSPLTRGASIFLDHVVPLLSSLHEEDLEWKLKSIQVALNGSTVRV